VLTPRSQFDMTLQKRRSEERMTAARVRHCWRCHTPFYKTEGCNKVRVGCTPPK